MRSVLLFSGGLDSTVLLYELLAKGQEVACLSFNYGQKHARELEFAQRTTQRLGLQHQIIDLSSIQSLISKSALTGPIEIPDGHYTDSSMKITVVPNRNMIMLSLAIGWAITLEADSVSYAAHSGDHTIYPDCRPEFIQKMREAAQLCDWKSILLTTPFERLSKSEIVLLGSRLEVPFSNTWSCYRGDAEHCGSCGTCVERREAFTLAKVVDPTIYLRKAA
jgi:7-cyano-7-deazaguanine synthase